ncbi:hypothetical protein D4764_17G0006850 [Takifugu flavidus]|uniref:Uncharacterized protein n=1 Tax=Takifugu flavidus TaxID=433684 RepID=A0A5C6NUQ2_9TELE|nr:hypothetical protein D4764_17G0006850 [Takifugu flavidus]
METDRQRDFTAGVTWLTDPSRGVDASEAQELRRLLLGLKSV